MGSVLCVGVKTVSKDRHGPSQGAYNQIIPKPNIKVRLFGKSWEGKVPRAMMMT